MKSFLALTLAVTSFSSFAFEKNATLDLTNVYGNNDVGLYEVIIEFTSKKTLSESSLKTASTYDDGSVTCTTSAEFEIGTMKLTMINKKTELPKSFTKKIMATVSYQSANEVCITSLETFTGVQLSYSSLGIDSIVLPVQAPLNYKEVLVYLAPYSGFFELKTGIQIANNKLVVNPSALMTEANVLELNAHHANLSYFVVAKNESGSLSLANGLTPLE